jgi:hypothetical protein
MNKDLGHCKRMAAISSASTYPNCKTEFVVGIVEEEEIYIVRQTGAVLFDVVFDCLDCNPRAPNVASGNAV